MQSSVRLLHIVVFLYIGDVISHGDVRTEINITISAASQVFYMCQKMSYISLFLQWYGCYNENQLKIYLCDLLFSTFYVVVT